MSRIVTTAADGTRYGIFTLSPQHVSEYSDEYAAVDPTWPAEKLRADFPRKWELSFSLWGPPDVLSAYCVLYWNDKFKSIHIGNCVVHPDNRGKGLGSLLMDEAVMRGVRSVKCKTDNVAAIALYTKYGFKNTGLDNGLILFRRPE